MTAGPPTLEQILARAVGAYRASFGDRPTAAACAPGRINLIGEHTDYTGGLALPMAIDRWCVAVGGVGGPAGDASRVTLLAPDLGNIASLDRSVPLAQAAAGLPAGDWSRYIAGVLAEFEEAGHATPPMNIAVASSVPVGAGLSSSAALEVAVATLLEAAIGREIDPLEKARLCQRAEHRWAGVRCGLMDQLAATAGREGHALLMDFAVPSATPIPLPSGVVFLVADTRVKHSLAAGAYGALVDRCERARAAMGLSSLRDATPALVERHAGGLDRELYLAARHVATENARVHEGAAALRAGDLDRFGLLMLESHRSLREYGVSCPELDCLVETLTGPGGGRGPGVFGARMTGAGFGGCIVAAVSPEAAGAATERLRGGYHLRHGRECDVFLVRPSGGARRLAL